MDVLLPAASYQQPLAFSYQPKWHQLLARWFIGFVSACTWHQLLSEFLAIENGVESALAAPSEIEIAAAVLIG